MNWFHGYMPESLISLIQATVVPIIKDKNKRINDKNNYRPICIANVCCKVCEKVFLTRIETYLCTSANQFGFEKQHGTEMCVFVLKELVRYYMLHWSHMFVAFLDASKAFDASESLYIDKQTDIIWTSSVYCQNHCLLVFRAVDMCKMGIKYI